MPTTTRTAPGTSALLPSETVVARIRRHIEAGTTDVADGTWNEPVDNYRNDARFTNELAMLRSTAVPFCPSAAIARPGDYIARDSAGVPIVAARGNDGVVRAFRNACRHRGAAVVCGEGHAASFVCPYHGWVYQLDGRLRRVPHDQGFPDLDIASTGLAELPAFERHGLVFVRQQPSAPSASVDDLDDLDELAGVITVDYHYDGFGEAEQPVNWKLLVETFLEGYHIRFLHHDTFFPVQYDNVNVVESFGPNSRITFPYQNIARPFDTSDEMAVRGRMTYVHHLFPNVMLATFPGQILMIVLDPVTVDRTLVTTFAWRVGEAEARPGNPNLLNDGAAQDFAIARTIQHGLASGANDHLRFGLYEGAIAHFHRTLDAALAAIGEKLS